MNESIILIIVLSALLMVFLVAGIWENFKTIKKLFRCIYEVIAEKLFDLITDFYIWRMNAKRRKAAK